MMVHGWPGTFYEFYGILPLLTETDSNVVFEVICPSIPGYGYSEAPHKKGKSTNMQRVARTNSIDNQLQGTSVPFTSAFHNVIFPFIANTMN